jgi:type VI secretion system FHA domain protein
VSVGPQPLPDDPFGADDPFGLPAPAPAAPPARARSGPAHHDPMPGEEVDPLNLLGLEDPPAAPSGVPRASDLAGSSVLSDHFAPPPVPAPPASSARPGPAPLIPEDYNPLLADDQQATPPPAPPRPAARSARPAPPPASGDTGAHARPVRPRPTSHGMKRPDLTHAGGTRSGASPAAPAPHAAPPAAPAVRPARPPVREAPPAAASGPSPDLAAMLAGAGLDPAAVTPELARSFGQILRVVVSGVMDVLQARQRIKDEFGMRMTTFRPTDNNPLKFSANVEDALHNLLVKRNAAYLGPVDAFEDAFGDVRNHQMAMLAGMRVAFESMLAAFDPERLQEEFERQGKKGALLTVPAKLRYWDLYREKFGDMVKDAEATFAELFGDEFARAYEEQLERLRARGRPDTR